MKNEKQPLFFVQSTPQQARSSNPRRESQAREHAATKMPLATSHAKTTTPNPPATIGVPVTGTSGIGVKQLLYSLHGTYNEVADMPDVRYGLSAQYRFCHQEKASLSTKVEK